MAQSLLCQGKIDEASTALQNGFRLAQEIDAPDVTVEAYCTKAEIQLAKNELVPAQESAQVAAKLATQIGLALLLATAWRITSVSVLRQGDIEKANQALEMGWQALSDSPDQLENGRLHAQAMWVSLASQDAEKAQLHFKTAEQAFKQLGASRDLEQLESIETQS